MANYMSVVELKRLLECELEKLKEGEVKLLADVLRRDAVLKINDLDRVRKLKAELQSLRWRGALRGEESSNTPGDDPVKDHPVTKVIDYSSGQPVSQKTRNCSRCRVELGRLLNRGSACKSCRLKVCKNCRRPGVKQNDWVCSVCHMNTQVQKATAEWMNAFIRRPSRRREPGYLSASDLVTNSLKRNWRVTDPQTKSGSSPDLRYASDTRRRQRTDSSPGSDCEDEMEQQNVHVRVAPRRSASLSHADGWGQGAERPSGSRRRETAEETARWRSLSPPVSTMLWTGTSAYTEAKKDIDHEWAAAEERETRSRSADVSPTEIDGEYPTLRRKKKRMDEMLTSEVKKFRERRKDVRTTTKETRRSSHGNVFYQTLDTRQTVRETDYTKRSQSLDRPNSTKQKHVNRIYLKQDSKDDLAVENPSGVDFEKVPEYAWTKRDTFKHITKERFAIPRGLVVEVKQNHEIPSYVTLVKPPRRQKSLETTREIEGMVTLPRMNRKGQQQHHVTRINIMQEPTDGAPRTKTADTVRAEHRSDVRTQGGPSSSPSSVKGSLSVAVSLPVLSSGISSSNSSNKQDRFSNCSVA